MIELVVAMSLMGNPVPKYRVFVPTPIREEEVVGIWKLYNKGGAESCWKYEFHKSGVLSTESNGMKWFGQWRLTKEGVLEIEEWMDTWLDINGVPFNMLTYDIHLKKTKDRDVWEVLPLGKCFCYGDGKWRRVQ